MESDVVLPQMLIDPSELARFAGAAQAAGAHFVERFVMDTRDSVIARFHRRGADDPDPWHQQVREIVASEGGDLRIAQCHEGLEQLLAHRPGVVVITSTEGEIDRTYRELLDSL